MKKWFFAIVIAILLILGRGLGNVQPAVIVTPGTPTQTPTLMSTSTATMSPTLTPAGCIVEPSFFWYPLYIPVGEDIQLRYISKNLSTWIIEARCLGPGEVEILTEMPMPLSSPNNDEFVHDDIKTSTYWISVERPKGSTLVQYENRLDVKVDGEAYSFEIDGLNLKFSGTYSIQCTTGDTDIGSRRPMIQDEWNDQLEADVHIRCAARHLIVNLVYTVD